MLKEIIQFIRDGDIASVFVSLAVLCFIFFVSMPVHECAHAWMAVKLGDETPRLKGRLTLSPAAHFHPIGFLMMVLVGFGFAKPVPVNLNNLKNGRRDFALVALAGPVSNLILAFIFVFLNNAVDAFASPASSIGSALYVFTYYASFINVSLAVFNLIPVPPLDGSRILALVLPQKYYFYMLKYERYISIAILLLLWIGVLDVPLSWLTRGVMKGFDFVTGLPFRFFT